MLKKRFSTYTNLITFVVVLAASTPALIFADTKVLVLGDSLTAGYGLEKEQAFPYLVNERLQSLGYLDIEVINAGFSGSTTASAVSRMRWYLKTKPDILILELGANDGLRGHPIKSIRKNLEDVIELSKSKGIKVLLAGMKIPRNYGKEYTQQFEGLYYSLAKDYEIPLIPFLLEGVAANPDLNLADGIHPNAKGHEIIAETVLTALIPIIKAD